MGMNMQNELTGAVQSTEFFCPNCGTAAFEVVGTQWSSNDDNGNGDGEWLVMRCLDCLRLFHYQLKGEESGFTLPELHDTLPEGRTRLSDN
jgi:hypothetical protein